MKGIGRGRGITKIRQQQPLQRPKSLSQQTERAQWTPPPRATTCVAEQLGEPTRLGQVAEHSVADDAQHCAKSRADREQDSKKERSSSDREAKCTSPDLISDPIACNYVVKPVDSTPTLAPTPEIRIAAHTFIRPPQNPSTPTFTLRHPKNKSPASVARDSNVTSSDKDLDVVSQNSPVVGNFGVLESEVNLLVFDPSETETGITHRLKTAPVEESAHMASDLFSIYELSTPQADVAKVDGAYPSITREECSTAFDLVALEVEPPTLPSLPVSSKRIPLPSISNAAKYGKEPHSEKAPPAAVQPRGKPRITSVQIVAPKIPEKDKEPSRRRSRSRLASWGNSRQQVFPSRVNRQPAREPPREGNQPRTRQEMLEMERNIIFTRTMSTQTLVEPRSPSDSDLPKESLAPNSKDPNLKAEGPFRRQQDYYSRVILSSVPLEERLARQQKKVDEQMAVEVRRRTEEFNRREVSFVALVNFRENAPGLPPGRPRQEPQSPPPAKTTREYPHLRELETSFGRRLQPQARDTVASMPRAASPTYSLAPIGGGIPLPSTSLAGTAGSMAQQPIAPHQLLNNADVPHTSWYAPPETSQRPLIVHLLIMQQAIVDAARFGGQRNIPWNPQVIMAAQPLMAQAPVTQAPQTTSFAAQGLQGQPIFGNTPLPSQTSVGPSLPQHRVEICWNCDTPGHRHTQCPLPRSSRFCYRCGRRGYDVELCPKCRTTTSVSWRHAARQET